MNIANKIDNKLTEVLHQVFDDELDCFMTTELGLSLRDELWLDEIEEMRFNIGQDIKLDIMIGYAR